MAKAVVMQVTDIKNRRQDMNTRQFLFTAADSIRPLRRKIRTLPKPWLAVLLAACIASHPLSALGAPEPHAPPLTEPWLTASNAGNALATATSAADLAATQQITPLQAPDNSSANMGVDDQGRADWRELEQGLQFGEFQLNDGDARLSVLRIDPAYFDFTLCARSQDSGPSRPLSQWGEQYNLAAAINASMYLPDGSTSTGYMRQGEHTNNGRIVQRFGAFFVAGPDEPGLPLAAILDRDNPLWRQQMERYSLVIQNYRMINADRRILWSPGGPHYSISAVAQDGEGQILFMHCRQPVEAYAFAQQVLHLPLNVRTVMYVEGGGQAGLLVRSAALTRELVGLSPSGLLVTGDLRAVLPNVLGARRKGVPAHVDQSPALAPDQSNTAPQPGTTQQNSQADAPTTAATAAANTQTGTQPGTPAGTPPNASITATAPAPTGAAQTAQPAAPEYVPVLAPSHTPQTTKGQAPAAGAPSGNTANPLAEPLTVPLTEPGTTLGTPPAQPQAAPAAGSPGSPGNQSKK